MKQVNLVRKTCDNFNSSIKRLPKTDQVGREETERRGKNLQNDKGVPNAKAVANNDRN